MPDRTAPGASVRIFVPGTRGRAVIDGVLAATDDEAYRTGRALARPEGLLVGISSGAAVGMRLAAWLEMAGKHIVVPLPHTAERYLSTKLFEED